MVMGRSMAGAGGVGPYIDLAEIADPGVPAVGNVRLFAADEGGASSSLKVVDAAGDMRISPRLAASILFMGHSGGVTRVMPQNNLFLELPEQADPAAPGVNSVRVYAKDSGAAKTQLAARFNTGAVQVPAVEP